MRYCFICLQLALCQRQLKEAGEQIKALEERLTDVRESLKKLKTDNERISKEVRHCNTCVITDLQ